MNHASHRSARLPRALLTTAACALGLLASVSVFAQSVAWNGWTFDHAVNGNNEGLSLSNVRFNGRLLYKKISLPVMRVFYTNNACGPYADRLGGTLSSIPWADNAKLAQRQFTLGERQWYEIGIRDQIGSYDLYQTFYLSADGILDAHVYGKGLQCVTDHVHYPSWRIDMALDGDAANVIERSNAGTFEPMNAEFKVAATTALNHNWRMRNTQTGLTVDVLPGFADFTIPNANTAAPVTTYDRNTVFGRAYRATEDVGWTVGPNVQVPFGNGESLAADPVLWYEAYMPHAATEGSNLWHSAGVRLVTGGMQTPEPPEPTANLLVRAKGDLYDNVGPTMDVRVNGVVVGSVIVSAQNYQDYAFTVPPVPAGARVDVVFRNDAWDGGTRDRNLYVEQVRVNNSLVLLPTAATYDRGEGDAAYDGQDVFPGSATMLGSGALRFMVPGGPVEPPEPSGPIAEVEPNNSTSAAQPLAIGQKVVGSATNRLDLDYYRVQVPAGATLTMRLQSPATGDFDLKLLAANGRSTLVSSRKGTGQVDTASWTNRSSAAVTVFVEVDYYSGAQSPYELSLF